MNELDKLQIADIEYRRFPDGTYINLWGRWEDDVLTPIIDMELQALIGVVWVQRAEIDRLIDEAAYEDDRRTQTPQMAFRGRNSLSEDGK